MGNGQWNVPELRCVLTQALDSSHAHLDFDVNPFMMELLGFPESYFLGKEPWQLGVVANRCASPDTLEELRTHGYVRYEHLPLQTRDGEQVQVEVVCNT